MVGLLLLGASVGFGENVYLGPTVTGDVSVSGQTVILTCDSNAADSSYGTFTTESFPIKTAEGITGYVRVTSATGFVEDTIVASCKTAMQRNPLVGGITLQVDTFADTGTALYWLGQCDNFTGADSLPLFGDVWIDWEVWDSTSDSAGHGDIHSFGTEIKLFRGE